MYAFWLITEGKNNGELEVRPLPDSFAETSEKPAAPGLYLTEGCGQCVARLNGSTLYAIGCFIYRERWGKAALELACSDLNQRKTIDQVIADSRGQFCLVSHENGRIAFATDRMGSFPIYMYRGNGSVQVSNLLLPLAKANKVSMDNQAVAEYLSFNYPIGGTFFNEITPVQRGTILRFCPETGEAVYDDYLTGLTPGKYTSSDEVASNATDILRSNFSFMQKDDQILADLTGGFDTRTNAVMLRSTGYGFETAICGEQEAGESGLAKAVANRLEVPFHDEIIVTERDRFDALLEEHLRICGGIPIPWHSTELINYYHHIAAGFDIHVAGFAGTQLFDQFLPELSIFSRKLNMRGLFDKRFRYAPLLPDSLMTPADFYSELERKFNDIIAPVDSRAHSHVATVLALSTFNRYYHGTLIGAHAVITPLYCPYLEADLARLMIQTDYTLKKYRLIQRKVITNANPVVAALMTSHGYSAAADIDFTTVRGRIRKSLKDFGRRLIYQSGSLRRIRKAIRRKALRRAGVSDLAETNRSFWVQAIDEKWSDDLDILSIIDRRKLDAFLRTHPHTSRLKAKILYLDWLLKQTSPRTA